MTVEVTPAGMACNLQCTYCYENPMRDAGNFGNDGYSFEAIQNTVQKYNTAFTLFGGEPLVAPFNRVEELLQLSYEKWGASSIQTNGVLITDEHVELFKQYQTHVGFSIDGPDELNDIRWAGSEEKTREATAKTLNNIKKLLDNNVSLGIIVTLHKLNASKDKLPRLKEWISELVGSGVNSIRLHILEVDSPLIRKKYVLSNDEYLAVFLELFDFEDKILGKNVFDKRRDIRQLLSGDDRKATCVWVGCDSYNTAAVRGVGADGSEHNCGRAHSDGVDYIKSDKITHERSIALYHTPQEYNGCKDCRFFLMCQGQCPGTAIDGDWRNRSEFCSVWKGLFSYMEIKMLSEGEHPFSMSPQRIDVENEFIQSLTNGNRQRFYYLNNNETTQQENTNKEHQDKLHGDHTDHGDSNSKE